jgi:phage FluMu protein Com
MKNMNHKPINCPHCGKILSEDFLNGVPKKVKCPRCGSERNWKAGKENLPKYHGIQRYYCRDCGTRFMER